MEGCKNGVCEWCNLAKKGLEARANMGFYKRSLVWVNKEIEHCEEILKNSPPHKLAQDKDDLNYDGLLRRSASLSDSYKDERKKFAQIDEFLDEGDCMNAKRMMQEN